MSAIINLTLDGERAISKPAGFLSGSFQSYLDACTRAGARFSAKTKSQHLDIEMVPVLVNHLKGAGFAPVIAPDLAEAMKGKESRALAAVDAAEDRLKETDEELKKRGLALFPFQRTGVTWLAGRGRGLLADEMGTGKTIEALIAIPAGAPVIVICPATIKGNWIAEAAKWRPDLIPDVLIGRGSWRWPVPGEIVVTNYDILPEIADASNCTLGTVLIADEAHAVKNTKAERTRRFKGVSRAVRERGGHVWLLTGTPLLNRPPELWNVLRAADLENQAFGDFHKFMKLFHAYKSKFGIKWGKPKPEVAECLKNAMLYRRREDVLPDLPTKIWRDIPVRLDREAWMICDELALKLESEGHSLDDMIESNVAFEELSKVRAALARAKIPTLLKEIEIYEDSEEPLIVFSAHREPVDQLALRPGWAAITGDVSHSERTRIVEEFQAGRLKGLALTIQAGGVGITLTMAHQCIFVDLMWTPALNKQAEDRLCRIGQTRGVIVNRLIGNHELDRHVMDVLHKKQMLIEGSVERAAVAT